MEQSYPAWRYHPTLAPVVVNDPEHEDAVAHESDGWAFTPAAFEEAEPEEVEEAEPEVKKSKRKR